MLFLTLFLTFFEVLFLTLFLTLLKCYFSILFLTLFLTLQVLFLTLQVLFYNAKGINHFSEDIIAYGSTITFEIAFIKENTTTIGIRKDGI